MQVVTGLSDGAHLLQQSETYLGGGGGDGGEDDDDDDDDDFKRTLFQQNKIYLGQKKPTTPSQSFTGPR